MSSDQSAQDGNLVRSSVYRGQSGNCEPCTRRKKTCDRARPLCTACVQAGLRCTGAVSKYTWKPGFSLTRTPVRQRRAAWACNKESSCPFIFEDPAASCTETGTNNPETTSAQDANSCSSPAGPSEQDPQHGRSSSTTSIVSTRRISSPATSVSAASPLDPVLTQPIQFSSLAERYQPVYEQYDTKFCQIPLTYTMRVNPFQCELAAREAPPSLLHAVMALGSHHLDNAEGEVHRQAAVHSLHQSIGRVLADDADNALKLLNTILLLFSLDETSSAVGCWSVHLRGAYNLLEASGGIVGWAASRRVVAQVGTLTWWDCIIGLMSRQGCIFPYTYFESALEHHDEQDWTFIGLCGCPGDLAMAAIQLAHLAAEKVKTATMRFVIFDDGAVRKIQSCLKKWCHIVATEAWADAETMQHDVDKMHCSEAWRHGLLLYISRVFHWSPGEEASVEVAYHARQVLDHVFACRDTGFLAKQTIFPLFLAGCEVKDTSFRERIAEFCSYWSQKTRFFMIDSVMPLLKEIWAAQEAKGTSAVSWWTVVDRWHTKSGFAGGDLFATFCFG